jgi:hypothetical protein
MVSSDETSSSPSSDSTSTPSKTPSGNSCKSLREIHRTDQVIAISNRYNGLERRVAIQHLLQGKQRPETPVKV